MKSIIIALLAFASCFVSCKNESKHQAEPTPTVNEVPASPAPEVTIDTVSATTQKNDVTPVKAAVSKPKSDVKSAPTTTTAKPKLKPEKEAIKTLPATTKSAVGKPNMQFAKMAYEFGTIEEGKIVKFDFPFTNIGTGDLEIAKTKPSCGCTVGSFSFLPIKPNEKGIIGATFDSAGKEGQQEAVIEVYTNQSKTPFKLVLTGFVTKKS